MSAAESPCPDFRAHADLTVLRTQTGGRSMAPQIHNLFTLFISEQSGLKDREPHLTLIPHFILLQPVPLQTWGDDSENYRHMLQVRFTPCIIFTLDLEETQDGP